MGSAASNSIAERLGSLRVRLLFIVSIALLPIALVSLLQGIDRVQRDVAEVRNGLIQTARTTAEDHQSILRSGEQILRAVGSLQAVRGMNGNCDGILADALIGVSYYTNLARLDANGTLVCSAAPLSKGVNISDLQVFQDARASDTQAVSPLLISRANGQKIIGTMLGQRDADGRFDGTVALTLDVRWFDYLLQSRPVPAGAVVAVYDRNGAVLASNDRKVAAVLAAGARSAGFPSGVSLEADDNAGDKWRFGNVALMGNNIFVAYAERDARLFRQTYLHVGIDFLLPIAMILFAWAAIWFATERQVTHWINYLKRIAMAYRSGHYTIRPDLAEAPSDFRQLGDTLSEMAEGIQDRDRRLREAVNLKTTLIKEIHHRVKNNLQIVMSLLSIQANQVKDPGARDALMQAQTRINALALVHRILNELEDRSTLDLKELLEELSRQIADGMGNAEHVRIETDVPHMVVASSVAVALALFTVEVLTNIFKHAFPRPEGLAQDSQAVLASHGVIQVKLDQADDARMRLRISDNGMGFSLDDSEKSVGTRLIRTFGAQLGGTSSVRSEPGRGTVVELIFPMPITRDPPAP